MRPDTRQRRFAGIPSFAAGALLCAAWAFVPVAYALEPGEADRLFARAELIKRSDYNEFTRLLDSLDAESASMTPAQRDYMTYLRAWQRTYAGDYEAAIPEFKGLIARPIDPTLRFRAMATLVNALTVSRRYDDSFRYLTELLDQLPKITDKDVRAQALGVAALLHNQVGQYDLSVGYANRMLEESDTPWVVCGAAQFKIESLLKSGRITDIGPEQESWVQRCVEYGEIGFANFMRAFLARLHVANGRNDVAIKLLLDNKEEVERTRYPRLISEFDSLLASTYWRAGDTASARRFALSAIQRGPANEFSEPLIEAYRVLSEISDQQGDRQAALEYHKKYMAADKAYLNDFSARQLAFQMAQHQAIASKLQIETLNQQNQLLQLKQDLAAKAVENTRLYLALAVALAAFIAYWAVRTKRSQLHFMHQAQHDSLTGIYNRPHFLNLCEAALEAARRLQSRVSVVIIDLDHFKIINDAHGHAAGDTVLKQAVYACKQLLGPSDIFGRLGGEEFGIMLVDRDAAGAAQLAEKCRLAIADTDTGDGRDEFPISASFGVTGSTVSGYKLQQLLAHADSALYQAKRQGRNRVEIYKGGPVHPASANRDFTAAH